MKLTGLFDRIYIINLPERSDRRKEVTEELARLGLGPTDGRLEFFPAIRPREPGAFPNVGTLGCYRSHLEVLRLARDQALRSVCILEDDVAFSKRLPPALARISGELGRLPWGIVHLGFYPYGDLAYQDYEPESRAGAEGSALVEIPSDRPVIGTHFYAVSGRAIGPLVEFLEAYLSLRIQGIPDDGYNPLGLDGAYPDSILALFRVRNPGIRTLVALPSLGWQRSSRSDLTLGRLDRLPVVSSLVSLLRPLKARIARLLE